jgi:putative transposase
MTNEFPHRKPTRYKDYDYSLPGYYFITICSHEMKYLFGNVINCKMMPNNTGAVVNNCWNEIPKHFKNVELDYYQLMPNHFHGIVIINSPIENVGNAKFAFPTDRTKMILSKAIQQFKRQVTIETKIRFEFDEPVWQKSFFDHVIRNEKELYETRKYIEQNPVKWDFEKNATENLFM